ncbi:MAG: endonuclease V [Nitrososphaerota archaeon]|nr:endonuclease V [Candidatus Bathyarchaeota archaeon]MDW8048240.1 endonuclease V [Nitrososphaerota archaeon]
MSVSILPHLRISLEEARRMQNLLKERIVIEDCLPSKINLVAGVDVAYSGDFAFGAVAVLDYESFQVVEKQTSMETVYFPYVPTLLSFREIRPAYSAVKRLRTRPDVFLVDGHGYAHPSHLGFATHLGLLLDAPTIGVAKGLLCGEVIETNERTHKLIVHEGKIIGAEVSTRPNVKPIYVSQGYKISLDNAIKIVVHCAGRYRIPAPLREAHITAQERKREEKCGPPVHHIRK